MIKKHKALLAYLLVLCVFTAYVVMDTFVITRVYSEASGEGTEAAMQIDKDTDTDNDMGSEADGGAGGGDEEAAATEQNEAGQAAESENGSHGHGPGGGKGGRPPERPGQSTQDGSQSHGGPAGKHRGGSGSSSESGSSTETGGSASQSAGSSGSSPAASGNSSAEQGSSATDSSVTAESASTQDSYSDGKVSVELKEYTANGSTVHVAEVSADSAAYLQTAFAQGSYGRNVTATTSDIAESVNAILAINGDYYGAREKGYVIRNGELYRDSADADAEDLVIYKDGSFGIINESEITAEQLLADGAVQTLSFGPALIEDGQISVDSDDEVGRAMASNPRTAIGIKDDGTYLFVVSDGRTDESEGLSLLELAEFMQSLGAKTAYNLDGGGSSTMVFNGSVVNTPTGGGFGNGSGSERKVSDIVYIGY